MLVYAIVRKSSDSSSSSSVQNVVLLNFQTFFQILVFPFSCLYLRGSVLWKVALFLQRCQDLLSWRFHHTLGVQAPILNYQATLWYNAWFVCLRSMTFGMSDFPAIFFLPFGFATAKLDRDQALHWAGQDIVLVAERALAGGDQWKTRVASQVLLSFALLCVFGKRGSQHPHLVLFAAPNLWPAISQRYILPLPLSFITLRKHLCWLLCLIHIWLQTSEELQWFNMDINIRT